MCIEIFVLEMVLVGAAGDCNENDAGEGCEHGDEFKELDSLTIHKKAEDGRPERIRLDDDDDEGHRKQLQIKGEQQEAGCAEE